MPLRALKRIDRVLNIKNVIRDGLASPNVTCILSGTVRRFLEKFPDAFDVLVFVVDSSDLCIYEVLLPLYFPRSKAEENAARWQLPAEVGGVDGEPLLPDRQIRIIDNPQHTFGRLGVLKKHRRAEQIVLDVKTCM